MLEDEFFSAKKKRPDTEDDGPFTEHHIETSLNELTRNDTSKSNILAPFNSTQTDHSIECLSVEQLRSRTAIKFGQKVREIDRQYERNNNCELDNGVYNKLDEEDDQGGEQANTKAKNQFDPFEGEYIDDKEYPKSPRENEKKIGVLPIKKGVASITASKPIKIGI